MSGVACGAVADGAGGRQRTQAGRRSGRRAAVACEAEGPRPRLAALLGTARGWRRRRECSRTFGSLGRFFGRSMLDVRLRFNGDVAMLAGHLLVQES